MAKKKWGPFPTLSDWVDANAMPELKAGYQERLYAVEYHLRSLGIAAQECSTHVGPNSWCLQENQGRHQVIVFIDPGNLVRIGDIAIREAASVIDTGLLLMNHVLALGIDATRPIMWKGSDNRRSVRHAIQGRLPSERRLIAAVDRVFDSIGYELLQGYRNWVTHRGAPKVLYARESDIPVFVFEAPEALMRETDPFRQKWLIERLVNDKSPDEFKVQCWPFVPQVEAVMSGRGPDPELIRRGIVVSDGVIVQNARFTLGSLLDDAAAFKARNPITLEGHRATVGGEELAIYSASDYTMAVRHVKLFIEDVVRTEWDVETTAACSRLVN